MFFRALIDFRLISLLILLVDYFNLYLNFKGFIYFFIDFLGVFCLVLICMVIFINFIQNFGNFAHFVLNFVDFIYRKLVASLIELKSFLSLYEMVLIKFLILNLYWLRILKFVIIIIVVQVNFLEEWKFVCILLSF